MRSLQTDLPGPSESSAHAEPPSAQEGASELRHSRTPAVPSAPYSHTKSCLKHAGVGKVSAPSARDQPKMAADHQPAPPVAYLQASSNLASSALYSSQAVPSAGLTPVFESAFSDASQVPAEQELRRQSGSSEQSVAGHSVAGHSVGEEWPETCSWTVPCHVFKYRTVTFSFTDPSLPVVLRPAINVSCTPPESAKCMP